MHLSAKIKPSRESILEILHNHYLLVRTIYSESEIFSAVSTLDANTFILDVSAFDASFKVTLISFDDGVCITKMSHEEVSMVRWMVVDTAKGLVTAEHRPPQSTPGYTLEETFTVHCYRILWWITKILGGGYHPSTRALKGLLEEIATEKVSVSYDCQRTACSGWQRCP